MSTLTQDAPLRAPAGATQWATVAMVVASGVVAAVQVGKAAIAVPMLQADLGLNLGAIGWLTGIFAILGVVGGIPAGAVVSSAGDKRVLAAGLLGIAAGAALGAATSSYAVLLGSRVLEGAGFLFVTVAAPAILGRPDVVAARHRDQAFALWSCFMPAGMAAAMLLGPLASSWQALWWAGAGLALLAALGVIMCVPAARARRAVAWRDLPRDAAGVWRAGSPAILAGAFGLYSLMFFALFSFLPVLLMERMAVAHGAAGALSALASAVNILGNLAAGYLLSRGVPRPLLLAGASLAMGATGLLVFLAVLPATPTFLLCMLFSAVGGLIPATLLSSAPLAAPAAALTPMVIGLIMQGNNLGQIVGPVAVGRAIDAYGWRAAALIVGLAALLAVAAAAGLRRRLGDARR